MKFEKYGTYDRELVAKVIAMTIMAQAVSPCTTEGCGGISFEEAKKDFGVDLYHDKNMVQMILDCLDYDIFTEVNVFDDMIDCTFGTAFCPYADDPEPWED